jgi:hypothetical protein
MTLASTDAPPRAPSATRTLKWTAVTLAFAALMTISGVLYLVSPPGLQLALARLGYPPYFLRLLGAAKLLGVASLLQTRRPVLREWAYAGFTFELIGALASHLSTGTGGSAGPAVLALGLLLASYRWRPRNPHVPAWPGGGAA